MKPVVYGADYSVYVRIVRMALMEKGVDHELVPVDVFAEGGAPGWYAAYHPFGRIPAFAHGDLKLFETAAIARYVDEAFAGPPLQPADASGRASMDQIIGMLDAYAYRAMVWDVAVERLENDAPDEALIAGGLRTAEKTLGVLDGLIGQGPWLLGARITLADLHAAAVIGYFVKAPDGEVLIARHPAIAQWLDRMANRESYLATGSAG